MPRIHALTMPTWGMSMTEGKIVEWRKAVGDIAWHVEREDYPAGQLASLRRLQPARPEGTPTTAVS